MRVWRDQWDRLRWTRDPDLLPDAARAGEEGIDPVHTPENARAGLTRYLGQGWTVGQGSHEGQLVHDPADAPSRTRGSWGPVTASIPYRLNDEPRRLMLGASLQSRAVPLLKPDVDPADSTEKWTKELTDATERLVADEAPTASTRTRSTVQGRALLVAFQTREGWTHEDAIVISQSAATNLTCDVISERWVEISPLAVEVELLSEQREIIPGERLVRAWVDLYALGLRRHEADALGAPGGKLEIDVAGAQLSERMELIGMRLEPAGLRRHKADTPRVPDSSAPLGLIPARLKPALGGMAGWYIATLRHRAPVTVGDKLATRHGIKGVVSRVLPDEEMPEVGDQRAEIMLSPVGVVRRGALGQFREADPDALAMLEALAKAYRLAKDNREGSSLPPLKDLPTSGKIYVYRQSQDAAPRLRAVGPRGFDLRLMSWQDGSEVLTSDDSLVIVGTDNNDMLHIRIFDADGLVTVTDETELLSKHAEEVLALKQQLPALLPPHVLTGAEKSQFLTKVTSILGQTRPHGVTSTPPGARGQRYGQMEWFALMAHEAEDIADELLSYRRSLAQWARFERRLTPGATMQKLGCNAINRFLATIGMRIDDGRLIGPCLVDGVLEIPRPTTTEPTTVSSEDDESNLRDWIDNPEAFIKRGGMVTLKLAEADDPLEIELKEQWLWNGELVVHDVPITHPDERGKPARPFRLLIRAASAHARLVEVVKRCVGRGEKLDLGAQPETKLVSVADVSEARKALGSKDQTGWLDDQKAFESKSEGKHLALRLDRPMIMELPSKEVETVRVREVLILPPPNRDRKSWSRDYRTLIHGIAAGKHARLSEVVKRCVSRQRDYLGTAHSGAGSGSLSIDPPDGAWAKIGDAKIGDLTHLASKLGSRGQADWLVNPIQFDALTGGRPLAVRLDPPMDVELPKIQIVDLREVLILPPANRDRKSWTRDYRTLIHGLCLTARLPKAVRRCLDRKTVRMALDSQVTYGTTTTTFAGSANTKIVVIDDVMKAREALGCKGQPGWLDDPKAFESHCEGKPLALRINPSVVLPWSQKLPHRLRLSTLTVVPPWLRPAADQRRHPLTVAYLGVIEALAMRANIAELRRQVYNCLRVALDGTRKRAGVGIFLRWEVLGRRLTRSARAVIVPDPKLRIDQVGLPRRITEVIFDGLPETQRGLVLLHRNPTLQRRNLLALRPAPSWLEREDNVIGLPLGILKVLGADFDGDQVGVVALETPEALAAANVMVPGSKKDLRLDPFRHGMAAFPLLKELADPDLEFQLAARTDLESPVDWCVEHAKLVNEMEGRLAEHLGWHSKAALEKLKLDEFEIYLATKVDENRWLEEAKKKMEIIYKAPRLKGRLGGMLVRQVYRRRFCDKKALYRAVEAVQAVTEPLAQSALSSKSGTGASSLSAAEEFFRDPARAACELEQIDPSLEASALGAALGEDARPRGLLAWMASPTFDRLLEAILESDPASDSPPPTTRGSVGSSTDVIHAAVS